MPNTQANRGTAYLKQWENALIEQRLSVMVTARCAWCAWTMDGTVADTRDAYHAHRTTEHPEVKPKVRRKRNRPFGRIHGRKDLDENIANARSQGGATWAGPDA